MNLNIIDDKTFDKVIKPFFLKDKSKLQRRKIDKFKHSVAACHLNLEVSEVIITVLGTVYERAKDKTRVFKDIKHY